MSSVPARGFALWALVIANSGVLLVLLFGPNANHPIAPLAFVGAALAVGGFLLIVRALIARRRTDTFPPTKAI